MDGMFIFIFLIIVVIGVIGKMADLAKKPNKGDIFACANCGKQTKHDTRTLRGFDAGVRKSFMCWECFKAEKNAVTPVGQHKGAGCVTAIFFIVGVTSTGLYVITKLIA